VHAVLKHLNESVINYDLVLELVGYIDSELGDDRGAILIFVPGIGDIMAILNLFGSNRRFNDAGAFRFLPLHSSLSPAEQGEVFERMPPGVRKVVVATNIAETSITIDDAVCVIDTVRQRRQANEASSWSAVSETKPTSAHACGCLFCCL